MAGIGFTMNEGVLRNATMSPSGMTGRWMFQKMQRARNRAVNYCPVRTGQ